MIMRYVVWLLSVSIAFITVSCTPRLQSGVSWYQPKPQGQLPSVTLTGKKICLDPGHGNRTSGAVGLYGTKEKDVNLAVARMLKTLLERRGAAVYLTREADTTTRWPANLSGREDLGRRCRFRDSLAPDLFVSIHHNGTEDGSRDVNVAKMFYAMEDAGASLDAANCINVEFSELLGLGPSLLLCGNFFILRSPTVPTVLGEASYLSHPAIERLLRDSAALHLEATAYFRGIVKWFALGVPKITAFSVDTAGGSVTAAIAGETPLDPLLTGIYCNGTRLQGKVIDNGYSAALPVPLTNKVNVFECVAGNGSGNRATTTRFSYTVDRPAGTLAAAIENQPVGSVARLRITALDTYGYPVKNGTPVVQNGHDTALTEDGIALFYVPVADTARSVDMACGKVMVHPVIPPGYRGPPPLQGFVASKEAASSDASCTLPACLVSIDGKSVPTDRNGFFSCLLTDTNTDISAVVTAAGFIDTAVTLNILKVNRIRLSPRAHGILFGKRIFIDPEFGGAETGGISAKGIRACDISRKIAYTTAGMLREYGAEVLLARELDHTIHPTERVFSAENIAAEVYIVIRSDSLRISPYIAISPGSTLGQQLAVHLSREWGKLSDDPVAILEEPAFVLQQTQCPAVAVSFCPLPSLDPLYSGNAQKIAKTVCNGLIDFFTGNSSSKKYSE
jgi:N-acetylmuramoyl-L-alanine amidase